MVFIVISLKEEDNKLIPTKSGLNSLIFSSNNLYSCSVGSFMLLVYDSLKNITFTLYPFFSSKEDNTLAEKE